MLQNQPSMGDYTNNVANPFNRRSWNSFQGGSSSGSTTTDDGQQLVNSPIPGADQYLGADNLAKKAYQQALASINMKRQGILNNYGYTAHFGKDGQMSGMGVDTHSLTGLLQQTLRGQAQENIGEETNSAGRGIFGGAAHQLLSNLKYTHGVQDAQLGTGLSSALGATSDDLMGAKQQYDNALWQNQYSALQGAVNNGQFNQADYSGLPMPDYANSTGAYAPKTNYGPYIMQYLKQRGLTNG